MYCTQCGRGVVAGARFCSTCGRAYSAVPPINPNAGIVRPFYGRVFGGVCAGLARQYGWDVAIVRIAAVSLALLTCSGITIAYIAAWILIPEESPLLWQRANPQQNPNAYPNSGEVR